MANALHQQEKNDEERHQGGTHQGDKHAVTVSVNEQPVKLYGHTATGAEIKAAAIAQGVHIQPNFVLQEELPNGTSRIVGDNDKVHLREHLRFTAIAPDDNS
jgi:Multiubiquitin